MSIIGWGHAHRRSVLFFLAVLIVGGVASTFQLPVSLFPRTNFPRVRINIEAGDRPAERMGIEVTWPVEEAVRSVPGVRNVRSTTTRGSAEIAVNFEWGRNMAEAELQIQAAITRIAASLPQGTTFTVRRMDPTVFPVMAYSLTSDTQSLVELRDLALYQLRPLLSTVSGVARTDVAGGAQEEYRVTVNPFKLASYGLSLSDVTKAVSASNVIEAVGRLEDHYKLYLIVSDTRLADLQQITKMVVRSDVHGVILLDDVATVSKAAAPQWIRVTADGHEAVIVQVYQQPGGNTVSIARALKAKIEEFRKRVPSGVKIAMWYDQSEMILSSAFSVRDAIIIGSLLAAFILLIFLHNIRITLIAMISVPGVLAATVLFFYVFDMNFNIMTLGGMAAAVGLIIDDGVVMVEHIMRRLPAEGDDWLAKQVGAAEEVTRPLAGSSACTIIIFAPLAFLSGVTGSFFKALSLTMAISLMISFLVAWLATPLLMRALLKQGHTRKESGPTLTDRIHQRFEALMNWTMERRWVVLVALIPLVAAGTLGYRYVGSGFMPIMDEGGFVLDYRALPGTSLTETDRLIRQVEAILRATPEVETYSRRTGLQLGGGVTEADEGDFFIKLKPFPRRPADTVMDEVRAKVLQSVPGLKIELAQLMEDLIGDLTGVPQPIEIKLYSDDGNLLNTLGPRVADAIGQVGGVVDVQNGVILAGNALDVKVDRERASREGVDPESVTGILTGYLSGIVATQIQKGPKMVGVRVWTPSDVRATERDIEKLQLRATDGHLFPLRRIATLTFVTGQPQIMREDLKRMIAVTGRVSGRDMGSAIRDVKALLGRPGLVPKEVYYSLGGLYEQQQIAFAGLVWVFAAAVLLVFLLLLFLYESFITAGAVMITTLLSVSAVFIGLWITNTELNISSMMGMTMILGIATEVAIFYVSEYYDLRPTMDKKAALIGAGKNRMRPIVMTTLSTILALLPLALGIGRGSAMQQPLAIAIISGLVPKLPLVLIVLPIMLTLQTGVKKEQGEPDTHRGQ
jgi:CzcA family heavy metal efflux pump